MNPHMVVVIPCHDEPELLTTLDALLRCHPPPCRVDVVVVINEASHDASTIKIRNRQTLASTQAWIKTYEARSSPSPAILAFTVLFEPDLSAKRAGVGTARKIGMDWALTRFDTTQQDSGVIVCLDADCTVAPNYLEALHTHFHTHPKTPGCSIYFEHPFTNLSAQQRQGIVHYELFLRYYLHGLRWSGFPHAFHTVGSSMAVRAGPYQRQGGMNRRKAGEDFYFLQKIIPLGSFSELRSTTVFPSARVSYRVPFGTGRSMADWLAGDKNPGLVYDPRVFQSLAILFTRLKLFRDDVQPSSLRDLPPSLQDFLKQQNFIHRLAEFRANTSSLQAFKKRFFHWFNAFKTLKYIHFATEHSWEKQPVCQAATTLLRWMEMTTEGTITKNSEHLLEQYRCLDKAGYWYQKK